MASTTAQLIRLRGGLTFCFRRGIPKKVSMRTGRQANVPQHWKIFHCSVSLRIRFGFSSVRFGFECSVQIAESSILAAIRNCNTLVYSLWQQVLALHPSDTIRGLIEMPLDIRARAGTAMVSLVAFDKLVLVQCLI